MDPDDRDRATGPDRAERIGERPVRGHGVDDGVRPEPVRGLEDRLDGGAVERDGTRRLGPGPSADDRVDRQHPPGALEQRGPHRAEPDRAQTEHHDGPARRDVGARGTGPPGAEVVGEQQRGLVVDTLGDSQELEVRGGDGEQLGLAATELAGAEHLGPLDAGHRVTAGAAGASPAARDRGDEDPVPHRHPTDVGTGLDHGADDLVADRDREERQVTVVEVQVRPADRRGRHRDDRTVRAGQHRIRHLDDCDLTGSLDHHCAHEGET